MNERDLFIQAIQIEIPQERRDFLDRACDGSPALRERLETLLRAHEQGNSFLDHPPDAVLDVTVDAANDATAVVELPGTMIGRYKLGHEIGHGGMGVVYLAVQKEPVKRKVALKIIKPGMDTREVVARFEAERQALALMDHQSIAHVLDGGSTESGRPYFVMELVDGAPITEYCDECRYTTRQRLELFIQVCHAVQHAHLKGVIHRDIKPSNILVTTNDHLAVPKVIDFGIAKALHQPLTEASLHTHIAQMIGTPMYMSPEQAQRTGLDIDTRTDVYSLGVLLYELLTGTTPFDRKRLRESSLDEVKRIIREEEPPRPSARLSNLDETEVPPDTIVEKHHTDLRTLTRELSGELDWIVMKAMGKDRNRRYESASDLAKDVQRYLDDEHVEACPPSVGYRFRKFVRRNRGILVAGSLVAISLVVGTCVAMWQAVQANLARQAEAKQREQVAVNYHMALEAVGQLLTRVAAEELNTIDEMTPIRHKIMADAIQFYDRLLQQNPADREVRLEVAHALISAATLNVSLEEYEEARTLYHRAIELLRSQDPTWASLTTDELTALYQAYAGLGDCGPPLHNTSQQEHRARLDHTRESIRVAEILLERDSASDHFRTLAADARSNAAMGLLWPVAWREIAEAEHHARQAVELQGSARNWQMLGSVLLDKGQIDEARECLQQALQRDSDSDLTHQMLGRLESKMGNVEQAVLHYRQSSDAYKKTLRKRLGEGHFGHWNDVTRMLRAQLIHLGRVDEAQEVTRDAVAFCDELLNAPTSSHLPAQVVTRIADLKTSHQIGLAQARLDHAMNLTFPHRKDEEALAAFDEAVKYAREELNAIRNLPEQETADSLSRVLAQTLAWRAHVVRVAKNDAEQAIADCTEAIGYDPQCAVAYRHRGMAYTRKGESETAMADFDEAVRLDPKDSYNLIDRADECLRRGDFEKAAADYDRAAELGKMSRWQYKRRAEAHFELGNYGTALESIAKSLELNPDDLSTLSWISLDRVARCPDESFRTGLLELAHKAIELNDNAARAYAVRGRLLAAFGQTDKALADYQTMLDLDPSHAYHYFLRGSLYLETLLDYEKALADFDESLRLAPGEAYRYKRRAAAHFHLGHFAKALSDLTQAVEGNAPDLSALWWIPWHTVAQCPDEPFRTGLLELADKAIELNDNAARAYAVRGRILAAFGQEERALADLKTALDNLPEEESGGLGLSSTLGEVSNLCIELSYREEAVPFLVRMTELQPKQPILWYRRALGQLAGSQKDAYDATCRAMVEQFQEDASPDNGYWTAWTCALVPNAVEDYSPLLPLAEQSVQADASSDARATTLGAILYRAGQAEEAVERLTEADKMIKDPAAASQSSPAYTWYFLAMAHHKLGHDDEAKQWLDKANTWTDKVLADHEAGTNSLPWNRRLTLTLLRDEAEQTIASSQ